MRKRVLILVSILMLPVSAFGDASDPRFRELVDEIMEVTGAFEIGTTMSDFVVQAIIRAMRSSGTEVPDRALELIEEEVQLTIRESIESGDFSELMYPIYAKYLDVNDLEAALRFYRTPEGAKLAKAAPLMATEGMAAGQKWGQILGPKVVQRVRSRLAEEGIRYNGPL